MKRQMKYLGSMIPLLFGLAACDFGSSKSDLKERSSFPSSVALSADGQNLTLEYCEDFDTGIDCEDTIDKSYEDLGSFVALAMGDSNFSVVVDSVDRYINIPRERVQDVSSRMIVSDDNSLQGIKDLRERDLTSALTGMVASIDEFYDKILNAPIPEIITHPSLTMSENKLIKIDCQEFTPLDPVIGSVIYGLCQEEKLIAHMRSVVLDRKEILVIMDEIGYGSRIRSDYEGIVAYLEDHVTDRQAKIHAFKNKITALKGAAATGNLVNVTVSSTPWVATQTKPELWLDVVRDALDDVSRRHAMIESITQRFIDALKEGNSIDIQGLELELRDATITDDKEKAKATRAKLTNEQTNLTNEISRLDREIDFNQKRLERDISKIVPANDVSDKAWRKAYVAIDGFEDLSYTDCRKYDENPSCVCFQTEGNRCENTPTKTINVRGVESVRVATEGEPKIVANGIYQDLNSYQNGFEKFHYYYTCFSGAYYKLPPRNRAIWTQWCSRKDADISAAGVEPSQVRPFRFIPVTDGIVQFDPEAKIMLPCIKDENGNVLEVSSEFANERIRLFEKITFDLCEDSGLTQQFAGLQSISERQEFVDTFLKPIYDQELSYFTELRTETSSTWMHRKGDTVGLDGYLININKGQSIGRSKSRSKSRSVSGGLGYIGSIGYSESTSVSSGVSESTSTSSSISVGYYHPRAPVQDSVVGKLMAECLDAEGFSLSPQKFFEIGKNAYFGMDSAPGCSYLRLFINDNPAGLDVGDQSSCTIAGKEIPGLVHTKYTDSSIFRQDKDTAFIDNDPVVGCTRLDENFMISVSLLSSAEVQLSEGLALVTDAALTELFGGVNGEGFVDIVANPNAEIVATNKINEVLENGGVTLAPSIKDILRRYVTAWVSGEKMKYKKAQLEAQKSLIAQDLAIVTADDELITKAQEVLSGIRLLNRTPELLNGIEIAFFKSKLDLYRGFLRSDLLGIDTYLNLYLDSLSYHSPNTAKVEISRVESIRETLTNLLSMNMTISNPTEICSPEYENPELGTLPVSLVNDLCTLAVQTESNLIVSEIKEILEQVDTDGTINQKIRNAVIGNTPLRYCQFDVFKNDSVSVEENGPLEEIGNGVFGSGPLVEATKPRLETVYVPLMLENNRINPDFDEYVACQSYSSASSECTDNLKLVKERLNNDVANDDVKPILQGYYRIDYSVDVGNCLNSQGLDIPNIAVANLEVNLKTNQEITDGDKLSDLYISYSPLMGYTRNDNGSDKTYLTYVDYFSYGSLAEEIIGERNWVAAQNQRISLSYNDSNGPCALNGYNNNACLSSLLGLRIEGETKIQASSALTNMRPNLDLSIYIPSVTDAGSRDFDDKFRLLEDTVEDMTLHLYIDEN